MLSRYGLTFWRWHEKFLEQGMGQDRSKITCRDKRQRLSPCRSPVRYACTVPVPIEKSLGKQQCTRTKLTSTGVLSHLLIRLTAGQAPETGSEASLFRAVQDIMENSAQSLRLTRLSGKRDMSTLLSQSAFSVQSCPAITSMVVHDDSLNLEHVVDALSHHRVERHTYHEQPALRKQSLRCLISHPCCVLA